MLCPSGSARTRRSSPRGTPAVRRARRARRSRPRDQLRGTRRPRRYRARRTRGGRPRWARRGRERSPAGRPGGRWPFRRGSRRRSRRPAPPSGRARRREVADAGPEVVDRAAVLSHVRVVDGFDAVARGVGDERAVVRRRVLRSGSGPRGRKRPPSSSPSTRRRPRDGCPVRKPMWRRRVGRRSGSRSRPTPGSRRCRRSASAREGRAHGRRTRMALRGRWCGW